MNQNDHPDVPEPVSTRLLLPPKGESTRRSPNKVDPGADRGLVIDTDRLNGSTPETVTGWGLDAATVVTFPVGPQWESKDDAWKRRVTDALAAAGYHPTDTFTEVRGLRWLPLTATED